MSNQRINILMTGGGAPGAAGILRCLLQEISFHILAADANPDAVGRWLATAFQPIPHASEPHFNEKILSICRENNIHALLPLVTRELIPLSLMRTELDAAGVKLPISSTSSLEIANNKSRLYEFLKRRGVSVPAYRVVQDIQQFKSAVEELSHSGKRVCFKPSVSNGGRGFRIISDDYDELDLLLNHKPESIYMRFEEAVRVLSLGRFPEILVSEWLPGEEYSVDCLANHGTTLVAIPRVRLKMINGISVEGMFVNDKTIIDYCTAIIKELELHGNIGIQVKRSSSGEYQVIEINPRVQGTISAALGAGVNLPVLAVKQELGLPINAEDLQVKWGTRFSRYWSEVFY